MVSPELRDRVRQFADGEISATQVEEWMVPRLRLFLASADSADADVVAAIELGLAEMGDRIRTEDEFRNLMKQVLREHPDILVYDPALPRNELASSNQSMRLSLVFSRELIIQPTSIG